MTLDVGEGVKYLVTTMLQSLFSSCIVNDIFSGHIFLFWDRLQMYKSRHGIRRGGCQGFSDNTTSKKSMTTKVTGSAIVQICMTSFKDDPLGA